MTFEQFKAFRDQVGLTEVDGIAVRTNGIGMSVGNIVDVTITWEGKVRIEVKQTILTQEHLAAFVRLESFLTSLELPVSEPSK